MISTVLTAAQDVFRPALRAVLWKSIGIAVVILIAIWFAAQALLASLVVAPVPWIESALAIIAGFGIFIGLIFLVAPITSFVASFFLDEIAETIEETRYPAEPPGTPPPAAQSVVLGLKFTGLVILVNVVALMLLLVPGINLVIFFCANGYLLGREYFELAAMRFHDRQEVARLRSRHSGQVFLAGLVIAGVLAIPLVNFLTPLFATALMVHLHKRLSGPAVVSEEPASAVSAPK